MKQQIKPDPISEEYTKEWTEQKIQSTEAFALLMDIYNQSGSVAAFIETIIQLGCTDFELMQTKWEKSKEGL